MSLSYITVGNTTLEFSGAQSVPVKGKGKGKQITGTFSVTAAGKFLPMQLIYAGKTNAANLKESHFQMDLTWHIQKTIGATKLWLSSALITLPFHTLKWRARAPRGSEMSSHLWCFQSTNNRQVSWGPWREQYCVCTSTTKFDPCFPASRPQC